ncbi:uncharacterized protein [Amphiura filiformis]|uniref:uncharacterized protein n=1 Tax=Amphiura filiformis TaxID=82378 RepID=UPI003B214D05
MFVFAETETTEQRETRLRQMRQHAAEIRARETAEEHETRLHQMRQHVAEVRAGETAEERQSRLRQMRQHDAEVRAGETAEECQSRLRQMRQHVAEVRAGETAEERQSRLRQMRQHDAEVRAGETAEECQSRLRQMRQHVAEVRAGETAEERQSRLRQMRQHDAEVRAGETAEECQSRLRQMRQHVAEVRAGETAEERQSRLRQMRQHDAEVRAGETAEECQSRLRQMRQHVAEVRAGETAEERQSRLRQMRQHDAEVRAGETAEELQSRLCRIRRHVAELRAGETPEEHHTRLQQLQEQRLRHTTEALAQHRKLGVIRDTADFLESDFAPVDSHHELPGLFNTTACPDCNSFRWKEERSGLCCSNGKVKLDPFPPPPEVIKNLYQQPEFLNKLRKYNNSLSLASLGVGREIIQHGYSPTVTIQGKMYHLIDTLLPTDGNVPKFAQLYFHDTDNEVSNRLLHNPDLEAATIGTLQETLRQVNPYIKSFKAAIEIQEHNHDNLHIVLSAEKKPSEEHARRYNLPTASEVAVILPGDLVNNIDVIVHPREGSMQRINQLHRSYDPLHYVMLFPDGTDGYHLHIPHSTGSRNVTPAEFYRYILQVREDSENYIMRSRRLLQQYACDQYAKIEGERLKYIKYHQKEIRAEKYSGLMDAIDHDDTTNPGRKVILPPTVYGSPRFYAEAFQDAMAIVRHYGKPSFFVTFTCNPSWPEIKTSLFRGEQPSDRPDICVRVFNIKLEELLYDLRRRDILGKVVAFTAVKEDQKRGLPHAHILLIMKDEDQPKTPSDIDRVVCAEIPDKTVNPRLYEIITHNNIHGPCGVINTNSPCMTGEGASRTCSKQFPKEFKQHTAVSQSTYPEYRRRTPEDGGRTHTMRIRGNEFNVDNRFIVPYNPLLSLKYNAHINVEVVHSVKAVKYLYKYITKGSDRVMVRLANGEEVNITNDEVERYVNARYVSASHALWRIYEFKLHQRYPAVMKLPCHLDQEQLVLFAEGQAAQAADRGPPRTKLTEWFVLNQQDPDAKEILYPDIPKHYTWSGSRWQKRKQQRSSNNSGTHSDMIGRIPVISLNAHQSELYFLRMLLHHQKGATSYNDLRTVAGEEQPTFQATCLKLGLLEDDTEIDKVMEEAAGIRFGNQLRDVFATILIWIRPSDPLSFYERHLPTLCEDLMHREHLEEPNSAVVNEVLIYLQDRLEREALDLQRDFGLPKPTATPVHNRLPREVSEELDHDIEALQHIDETNYTKLNEEQREVYNTVVSSVDNDEGLLVSLDASGGTGKTFVLSTILAHVRSKQEVALATAMSGIAATLLPKGRTLHSRLKVPINITDESTCNITSRCATADLIRRCKLLVIDEVSMANRRIIEAVDRTMQDIRQNNRIFGGVTVVLSGDWRQILPVVRKGGRAEVVDACIKSSPLWSHVKVMKLSRNMRVAIAGGDERDYAKHLLDVGEGTIPVDSTLGQHKIKIKDEFVHTSDDIRDFSDFVFPELERNYQNPEWLTSRAILCPTNDGVDKVNNYLLGKFPGVGHVFKSSDTISNIDERHHYPEEFLNTLNPSGLPHHELRLKENAPIILLRNIDPIQGHCNGTKYVVTRLNAHIIDATIASGIHVGRKLFIPRISLSPSENLYPFRLQRRQFPIKSAFAMTSNKSQGQTLSRVGIYLEKDFFSHGQLYVSMSRVGHPDNLRILSKTGKYPGRTGTYTSNVVYHEVL